MPLNGAKVRIRCVGDRRGPDRDDGPGRGRPMGRALLRGGAEGLTQRPAPRVWSPLEYGAHVRDVIRLFTERVAVIVSTDSPRFVGWDQEAAATAARAMTRWSPRSSPRRSPPTPTAWSGSSTRCPRGDWGRSGTRDGREFTVEFLLRYLLHDVEHHWYDVS